MIQLPNRFIDGMLLDDAKKMVRFRRCVSHWFAENARTLPWRGITDPYRIWVSEIMLQQTTVKTVEGYFDRFVERFPTVQALAEAELSQVNRYWEGLGYYRRCSQMHKSAREITERFDGQFPRQYKDVLKLPGIGRYTAGAVLSLAFDERLPILETNTVRLHSRLLALQDDPRTGTAQKQLWTFAEQILPRNGSGHFNLALMDIGNAVCRPKEPDCAVCPVVEFCEAAQSGLQCRIPFLPPPEEKEDRTEVALLIRKNRKILMIQHPEHQRWAGLWDFPRAESEAEIPLKIAGDNVLRQRLRELTGYEIEPGKTLKTIKHTVTRYRITLYFCEGTVQEKRPLPQSGTVCAAPCNMQWVTVSELEHLPLHSTARKLALFVNQTKD